MARVSILSFNKLIAAAFSDVVLLFDEESSSNDPLVLKHESAQSDDSGEIKVVSMDFNADGQYLVVVYSDKMVGCWCCSSGTLKASTKMPKKLASCVVAPLPQSSNSGSEAALVGDKTGDVFALSFPDLNKRKLMLGHTASIITSMSIIPPAANSISNYLLATADRDEKVRISYWPQTSLISSFCLGHVEYVSSVSFEAPNKPLLSLSGDGSLKAWDLSNDEPSTCSGTWQSNEGVPVAMARLCTGESDLVVVAIANHTSLKLLDVSNVKAMKVVSTLNLNSTPLNMNFYDSGKKLLVLIDASPYILVFENKGNDGYVLSDSQLSNRASRVVEASNLKCLSALSLDDNELCDSNVTAEPAATSEVSEATFVPGASELRKRVVSRPCQDWNSKKRLTVQGSGKRTDHGASEE